MPQWAKKVPIGDTPLYIHCAHRGFIAYIDEFMSIYRKGAINSWYMRKKNNPDMEIINITSKIEMYNDFNSFTEGKYKEIVYRRILHYAKRYLQLVNYSTREKLLLIKGIFKKMPIRHKANFYYLLFVYFPLQHSKALLRKKL